MAVFIAQRGDSLSSAAVTQEFTVLNRRSLRQPNACSAIVRWKRGVLQTESVYALAESEAGHDK